MRLVKKMSFVLCFLILSVGTSITTTYAETDPTSEQSSEATSTAEPPNSDNTNSDPDTTTPTDPITTPSPMAPIPSDPTTTEPTTPETTPSVTPEVTPVDPLPDDSEDPELTNIDAPPTSHVEPAAPTSADGVKPVSRTAYDLLGFPMRSGFVTQPESIQYAKFGTDVHLRARVTGLSLNPLAKTRVFITRWDWTGERWQPYADPKGYDINQGQVDIVFGPSGRLNLPVGIHYFQLKVSYGLSTYHSALAKIGISEGDVQASGIISDVENDVNLVGLNYSAYAYLNPGDATSQIQWQASNGITYDTDNGHTVTYAPTSASIDDQVNQSTSHPGLPETLTTTAINTDGTSYSYALPIYVGGLAAIDLPIEKADVSGFTWPIHGLDKLTKEFYGSTNPVIKSASFQWNFYGKDSNGTYVPITLPSDVQNASGTFSIPDDLNDTKALFIPPKSDFLLNAAAATAAGSPYYANLTITLAPSSGRDNIIVTTNNAELRVHPNPNGYLSLDTVPNFDFGSIDPNQIYNGNTTLADTEKPTSTNTTHHTLSITDTRTLDRHWYLQAQLSPFTDIDSQVLNNIELKITGLASTPISLRDNGQWLTILDSSESSATDFEPQAMLTFHPSPDIQLYPGQTFHSRITWSLTPDTPPVPAL